jgi:hypothetical protein
MPDRPPVSLYAVRLGEGPAAIDAELDSAGLTLRVAGQPERHWAWSQILGAEPTAEGLRVRMADGGALRLALDGGRRRTFLSTVARAFGQFTPDGRLTTAEIERCLGVGPGGSVAWRVQRGWLGFEAAVALAALVGWAALCSWLPIPSQLSVCVALLLATACATLIAWWLKAWTSVSADSRGLVARDGGRRVACPWSQVVALTVGDTAAVIATRLGSITVVNEAEAQPLLGAVRRVLGHRCTGHGLPDQRPADDAALSRMGGEPGEADLGLSLTESGDG